MSISSINAIFHKIKSIFPFYSYISPLCHPNEQQKVILFSPDIDDFLSSMWDLFSFIQYKAGIEGDIPKYGTGIIIPAEMDGETFLLKLKKCI